MLLDASSKHSCSKVPTQLMYFGLLLNFEFSWLFSEFHNVCTSVRVEFFFSPCLERDDSENHVFFLIPCVLFYNLLKGGLFVS